jgi:hypothetical protein
MTALETSSYIPTFDEMVWALAEIGEYEGDDTRLTIFQQNHAIATSLAVLLKYKSVGSVSDPAMEMLVRSFYSYCDHIGLSTSEVILSSEQPAIYDEFGELVRAAQPSKIKG